MKKLIMLTLSLVLVGFISANAQEVKKEKAAKVTVAPEGGSMQDKGDKVKVKSHELPEAVRTTLAGNDYSGWEVTEAIKVKTPDKHFVITLKKGTETKTVKLDKEGKSNN
jgi:hypothetical protein